MSKPKILVIDDDEAHRSGMVIMLEDENYAVDEAESGENALIMLKKNSYDLVVTDYKMHKIDGMELLKIINDMDPLLKVIMVTGFGSIEHAVQAIHYGALDYIQKPVEPKKLKDLIRKALDISYEEKTEMIRSDKTSDRYLHFGEIVGRSKSVRKIINKVNEISDIDVPVLITGESGTGKELVARAIHNSSKRKDNSFVAINTGAIAKDLINSELFGHEKGAFTGAIEQKKGKFEEAKNGTLFLDEISTMSQEVQISLLRVLENKMIDRVGGKNAIPIDVRIVAATNDDLEESINKGNFREDLYYRLNVFSIELAPLRERKEDIPLLCDYFIENFNNEYSNETQGVDEEAMSILCDYPWKGNIRELRNVVLRAMISSNKIISKKNLPKNIVSGIDFGEEIKFRAGTPLPEIERESIIKTIKKVKGNKLKAAELLGISRRSLYNKIEEYKIRDDEFE